MSDLSECLLVILIRIRLTLPTIDSGAYLDMNTAPGQFPSQLLVRPAKARPSQVERVEAAHTSVHPGVSVQLV